MKILVGVKRVVDYAVKVRVDKSGSGVDLSNVKMSLNPFCEIALEEAVRLKEKKVASEIISLSIGPKACQESLRTALAIGADRAIHVLTDLRTDSDLQPLVVAKIFKHFIEKEKVDLVLVGKQSIDSDNCQTGPMIAGLLGWSQATFASSISIADKTIDVERETDTGTQKINITLPSVISVDLRLNEPRYATLPNIMKAKKKSLETVEASTLGIDLKPRNTFLKVEEPEVRKAGIIVDSVDVLIDKLKNEAAVI